MFRRSRSWRQDHAFTLIELLIVLAIISLLVAIIFPSLIASRRKAYQTTCLSNEHQIGKALGMFLADHDEKWPYGISYEKPKVMGWWAALRSYIKMDKEALACPEVVRTNEALLAVPGYAYNSLLSAAQPEITNSEITYPSLTVSFCDAPWGKPTTDCWDPWKHATRPDPAPEEAWKRHQGGAGYLFCDAHVKWYLPGVVECVGDPNHIGVKPGFELH